MFQWFWISVSLMIFINQSLAWPSDLDSSKMCLITTSIPSGDIKCAMFCRERGKFGGNCQKKRCVCYEKNDDSDDEEDKDKIAKQQIFTNYFNNRFNEE